jgi:hypothetical protein
VCALTALPSDLVTLIIRFVETVVEGKLVLESSVPLHYPSGVAVAENTIAVCEYSSNTVKLLNVRDLSVRHVIGVTDFAGRGNNQFDSPCGLVISERDESMYVADRLNHRIQVFNFHTARYYRSLGRKKDFAKGKLQSPVSLAINESDDDIVGGFHGDELIFIAEADAGRITVLNRLTDTHIHHWGKNGTSDTEYQFAADSGLCLAFSELYTSDTRNDRIKIIDPIAGRVKMIMGGTQLSRPTGIVVSDLYAYVCDYNHHRIVIYRVDNGDMVKAFGCEGTGKGQFRYPTGIGLLTRGCKNPCLIVVDCYNNRLQLFC